jgi:ankyrin repeat protein
MRLCVCVTVCDSLFPPQVESTPLHCAADNNRLEVAQVLLANGADVNARSKVSLKPNTCVYI